MAKQTLRRPKDTGKAIPRYNERIMMALNANRITALRMLDRAARHWRKLNPKTRRLVIGLAAGIALPIFSAFAAGAMETHLDVRVPSMTFLCSVIVAAIWLGRRAALLTALGAFLIYNFYLSEPRNTIAFAGFEDVFTLLIFVGTALLLGGLAGHLHDERERAREQARVFSILFDVSRDMATCGSKRGALETLVHGVRRIAASEAAVFHAKPGAAPQGGDAPAAVQETARRMLSAAGPDSREAAGWRLQVLRTGGKAIAVLAWSPPARAGGGVHEIAVRLLIDLTLSAVERIQSLDRQIEIDALAATDKLRTALMSSISHDFRTPLSTILTSASSLQAYGDQFSPGTRADLLASIQEEAERLNRFVSNILNMTRLDAGVVAPREEWIDPIEIVENVEARVSKRLGGRSIEIVTPAAVPAIRVDPLLLEQALLNAVENALIHTPSRCAIRIGADYSEQSLRLWVEDDGPGVSGRELPLIFDKFHRLTGAQGAQGAGLGLAICKGFVEAMHGRVRAVSPVRQGQGLRVECVFPLQAALAGA